MPEYVVQQGEVLQAIVARECGMIDPQSVIEHEKNEALFAGRPHNQLRPGDTLWLPEPDELPEKTVTVPTGQRKRLVLKLPKRELKLRICTQDHEPASGTSYSLDVEGTVYEGSTDGDGFLTEQISPKAQKAVITMGEVTRELDVGALDPIHTRTGVQARLSNLGYPLGPIDGIFGRKTLRAVKSFQHNHGLKVDGHVGKNTRAKLLEVYGC